MEPINFHGREITVSGALPLKIKDWKALDKLGVSPNGLTENNIGQLSILIYYILSKADPSVTQDEVDDLTMEEAVKIIGAMKLTETPDRPTLMPSTS